MSDATKVRKIREILEDMKPPEERGSTYYIRMLYLGDIVQQIRKVAEA